MHQGILLLKYCVPFRFYIISIIPPCPSYCFLHFIIGWLFLSTYTCFSDFVFTVFVSFIMRFHVCTELQNDWIIELRDFCVFCSQVTSTSAATTCQGILLNKNDKSMDYYKTVVEFWTNDPMTGHNKRFFFYALPAISSKNLPWLDHNFKYGGEKLKK